MPQPQPPNVTDFTTFLRNIAGIGTGYLPDGSLYITYALDQALNIVNIALAIAVSTPGAWSIYQLAVFNLGTAMLVEFAPPQSWTVASISWAANLVTVTTSAPHTIAPQDVVAISGVSAAGSTPKGYNGTFTVASVPDDTHVTYPLAPNPGTGTPGAGAAVTQQFFVIARGKMGYNVTAFQPGVIGSTSDQGTSASYATPDFMRGLSLYDLQLLKSPFGRAYLALAQRYGPAAWGLS